MIFSLTKECPKLDNILTKISDNFRHEIWYKDVPSD